MLDASLGDLLRVWLIPNVAIQASLASEPLHALLLGLVLARAESHLRPVVYNLSMFSGVYLLARTIDAEASRFRWIGRLDEVGLAVRVLLHSSLYR